MHSQETLHSRVLESKLKRGARHRTVWRAFRFRARPLCAAVLPALVLLVLTSAACDANESTVADIPTETASEEPATGGHGPPVVQSRELPDDKTGGIAWVESNAAGATWRFPADDSEWELLWSDGGGGDGFAGLPFIRVTHLTTGRARIYSLLDGTLVLCSDRSGVLAAPTTDAIADQGVPTDCASQSLTPQERDVFGHVKVTGSYERYHGPLAGEPTFPGLTLPTARPDHDSGSRTSTPTPLSPEQPTFQSESLAPPVE